MKLELTTYDIANRLLEDEYANWSRAGAFALAEWLEELEEGTGEEAMLDVVALRCEFSEYGSLIDWAADYFSDIDQAKSELGLVDGADDGAWDDAMRQHINYHGFLIEFDGGIIVSSF
jgi:hypothetical protein